ncbi:MAG: ATP-binding protein [Lachnospiraceae bacterium]|nr:ATP-binding protein [Lachnospiraceae bacterium]
MSLKNYQYNAIIRMYDERRSASHALILEREKEIEQNLPAYTALKEQIIENSMRFATTALFSGDNADANELRRQNEELSAQKNALLLAHGYPADYLSPVYTCKDCRDTGMIGDERCHCFKQAVVDYVYAQSNIAHILKEENFDTFSFDYYNNTVIDPKTKLTPRQNMQRIYDTCQAFVRNFDTEFNNLLFYGNSGLGKTFLSHCIAKELLGTAHTVLYLTAHDLFDLLGKAMYNEDEDFSVSCEHILDCDLLIIDDLGTELANAFTLSRLSLCINERLVNRRSTIISTNFGVQELSDHYGERNFSRIFSSYTPLRFFGEDIRIKKKVENA